MAGSVNKVILVGKSRARPPRCGGSRTAARCATSASPPPTPGRTRRPGERRERTEWHSVAIFSEPLARTAEAVSAEWLEGLSRRPARNPQVAGPVGPGQVFDGSRAQALQPRPWSCSTAAAKAGGGGGGGGGGYNGRPVARRRRRLHRARPPRAAATWTTRSRSERLGADRRGRGPADPRNRGRLRGSGRHLPAAHRPRPARTVSRWRRRSSARPGASNAPKPRSSLLRLSGMAWPAEGVIDATHGSS